MKNKKSQQSFYYIGLMSGTSLDGIDTILAHFSHDNCKVIASDQQPIPENIKKEIITLSMPSENEIKRLGKLDIMLGEVFSEAILTLLKKSKLSTDKICAIGNPGQTIRHMPNAKPPFTLQIGSSHIIKAKTGITTISNFRGSDMAEGGEGAPLAPAFHEAIFRSEKEDRFIVNIGGMANISYLPKAVDQKVIGFDTGPGNVLLNGWIEAHQRLPFDAEGSWAASGKPSHSLLDSLLKDPYFHKEPPKSTGREYFNLNWLDRHLAALLAIKSEDIQATLAALTAETIANSIKSFTNKKEGDAAVFICGGGSKNRYLMEQLQQRLPKGDVQTTEAIGMSPDWVEAALFAWLAKQRVEEKLIDLTHITGAKRATILGAIY